MSSTMMLSRLEIRREEYGRNKGRLTGRVFFQNELDAAVQIPLDEEMSRRVLAVCAEEVTKAGNQVATLLTEQVMDQIASTNLIAGESA